MRHINPSRLFNLLGISLFMVFSVNGVASSLAATEQPIKIEYNTNHCPSWLNQDINKLRSKETFNLCEVKQDKVLLIVNTASSCGFTPQFKGLESLYQQYKDQGLVIIGFPSDSFFQEYDEDEKTADVCYINYGVTFLMAQSSSVRGSKANPIFKHLSDEKGAPKWNFYKYLVGRDGEVIDWYNSRTKPNNKAMVQAIEKALNHKK